MAKNLIEVLEEQGIQLTPSSQDRHVAICMFHNGDREPSFTVYPNDTYWCFGCRTWGNPVKFMVDYKGMTEREALDYVGLDYEFPKSEKRVIKVKNTLKTSKFLYEVALSYHNYLMSQPGPQKYIQDRGLTLETAKKFLIGYTDGAVLDLSFAADYELANEVGLLSKWGQEALAHRITIPNIIDNQFVDFMIGRTVVNAKMKYLGLRMPKPIMGFYDSRNSPVLFLVEGNFDYLLLRQWGYPAIVMSGTHVTKNNLSLIREKTVIIVPDNDADYSKGPAAAAALHKVLPNSQILDYRSLGAKDIGELGERNGKALFDKVVEEQLWNTPFWKKTWTSYLPSSLNLIPSLSI